MSSVHYYTTDSDPCQCDDCRRKRMTREIHDKIIPPNPGNVIPELSPDWNFDLGMLESNSKPVGMVAKKWIVKD